MDHEDLLQIKSILDKSLSWEPAVLEQMPRLFLLIRENYIRGLAELERQ